jgi:hypothetical protein
MYHAGQTKNELLDEIDINAIQRERGKGGLPEHRNGGRWKHRSDSKNDRNVERLGGIHPSRHRPDAPPPPELPPSRSSRRRPRKSPCVPPL